MSPFEFSIAGKSLNRYIGQGDLDVIEQKAEGESLWDYRLDSVSVAMDKSALAEFGLTDLDIYDLNGLDALIKYYGSEVLAGQVESAEIDLNNDELKIDIASYAKIIASQKIIESPMTRNIDPLGESLGVAIIRALLLVTPGLIQRGVYPHPAPVIDVDDFEFMRSVEIAEIALLQKIRNARGEEREIDYIGIYHRVTSPDVHFLVGRIYHDNLTNDFYFYLLHSSGVNSAPSIILEGKSSLATATYAKSYQMDDSHLLAVVKDKYDWNSPDLDSTCKINDLLYYMFINDKLLRLDLDQLDRFVYDYTGGDFGQLLRDFAIASNSMVWIGNDKKIYYQSRFRSRSVLSIKTPLAFKKSVADHRSEVFELPEAHSMLNIVKNDLANYYSTFLDGNFARYETTFRREEFPAADFPLIFKNLSVTLRGKIEDCGIIKQVKFREDIIEIESERRLDG
jgi:hypothetical protein